MINRVLIRSKVLQMVYAYYQSDNKDLTKAEKEFQHSLQKSYELYHYLLLLIPEITHYASLRMEQAKNKYRPTFEEQHPNTRFIDNRFAEQVRVNKALNHFVNNEKISWSQHEGLIRKLYEQIVESPVYLDYLQQEECTYSDDKEVWRKLFKQVIGAGDELPEALEELCIYWNDDLDIVLSFIQKTIKRFEEENGDRQALLPMYKDNDDRYFAEKLFRLSIVNGEEYRQIIVSSVKNWEIERMTTIDLIIMQIALAEILEMENIPLSVSFNEYIDLAKLFSTEKSGVFINGTLDNVVQTLKAEHKLFKSVN